MNKFYFAAIHEAGFTSCNLFSLDLKLIFFQVRLYGHIIFKCFFETVNSFYSHSYTAAEIWSRDKIYLETKLRPGSMTAGLSIIQALLTGSTRYGNSGVGCMKDRDSLL
jgi:hypothetical protein